MLFVNQDLNLFPVTVGRTVVGKTLLETIGTITKSYFQYKLFGSNSVDNLPQLLGNTTQTLIMTNSLIPVTKDLIGFLNL